MRALALSSLMLLACLGAPAQAQPGTPDLRLQIRNGTQAPVAGLYVSRKDANAWSEDILEGNDLVAEPAVIIDLGDGGGYCRFDFKAVLEDGTEIMQADYDVCAGAGFTLETRHTRFSQRNQTATFPKGTAHSAREVTFRNKSGDEVRSIVASRAGAAGQGTTANLLDGLAILDGMHLSVAVDAGDDTCWFDLRVMFERADPVNGRVDVCAVESVDITTHGLR